MIITSAPLRISLFGGGSDYPDYYLTHGGQVLSFSINKRVYVSLRETNNFSEYKYKINYSKIECCNSLDEIEHPAVQKILSHFDCKPGFEINIISDYPARTGLGSSSAFTVAMLKAMYKYLDIEKTNYEIALDAIYFEQKVIGDRVGSQDQYASAIGGVNQINFEKTGCIDHIPVNLTTSQIKEIFSSFHLVFTGEQRLANNITKTQIGALKAGSIFTQTKRLSAMVEIGKQYLKNCDLRNLGELLEESWCIKRSLTNKITNDNIDRIYDYGKQHGAFGGKLLGAGGGGFIFFVVPPENRKTFINGMHRGNIVPVEVDFTGVKLH